MDFTKDEILHGHGARMSQLSTIFEQETYEEVLKDVDPEFLNDVTNSYCYEDSKEFVAAEVNAMNINPSVVQTHPDSGGFLDNSSMVAYHSYSAPMTPSMNYIPANGDFPGEYDFEILLSSQPSTKYNWVYSQPLNKVFINMGNPLPVDFKWNPAIPDLWIRATPLFAQPQHSQEHVLRCLSHSNKSDVSNKEVPEYMHPHVIRCNNPLTRYCKETDGRLTVLTPLGQPQTGTDSVRLMYTFMCKNSCATGMNRKPLEIIYTLESHDGRILGRRKHGVRICSCPKRDKDKEEGDNKFSTVKKRKYSHTSTSSKKLLNKDEPVDLASYKVPSIEVIGAENVKRILRYAYDLMAGDSLRASNNEHYKPYMDEVERELRSWN